MQGRAEHYPAFLQAFSPPCPRQSLFPHSDKFLCLLALKTFNHKGCQRGGWEGCEPQCAAGLVGCPWIIKLRRVQERLRRKGPLLSHGFDHVLPPWKLSDPRSQSHLTWMSAADPMCFFFRSCPSPFAPQNSKCSLLGGRTEFYRWWPRT